MRSSLIIIALALSPFASAHELDYERTVTPEQVELAKNLPQTVVVRVNKSDPSKIAVLHSKEAIPAGTKLPDDLKFEAVAMNAEVAGLPYDATNELDNTSSTSSWFFAVGNRGWGGCGRWGCGYRAYRPAYYGYPYTYGYRPYYQYAGYNYNYAPYWGYSTASYNYSYCNWYY